MSARPRAVPAVLAALGGLAVGGLAWAVLETRLFTLRRVDVPVLPPGTGPIRVLHISDLHLVPSQRRKRDWVRALADLDPHVVVDTGDNMAHDDALPAVLDTLAPLTALPGAFVFGSNDYYAPKLKSPTRYLLTDPRTADDGESRDLPADELARGLRDQGWIDLTNRRDSLVVEGVRLDLVGVDDPHLDRDVFPPPEAASGGGQQVPTLRVGVTHAPYLRVLDQMHADGAELVLAGHTHGGQLCLPFYGTLVTNCDLDRGRAKGLSGWPGPRPDEPGGDGSTWLHVSAGLGTSPFAPVRFACRPEATLLTLVPR